MAEKDETYYLSQIPKIKGYHPIIQKKYDKEVNSWLGQKFLETPHLSDQYKIKTINRFNPEVAKKISTGIHYAKKVDNTLKSYSKLTNNKEALEDYNQRRYLGDMGGSNRKTRKTRKTKNNRKNKKRTRK